LKRSGANPQELLQRIEDDARKTVKAQLVVDAIGEAAGIVVDEDDLGREIARQAARIGRPPEELFKFMNSPERVSALYSDAYRRKAIDHLLTQVQVLGGPPPAPSPEQDAAPDA
jgi:trigger factor